MSDDALSVPSSPQHVRWRGWLTGEPGPTEFLWLGLFLALISALPVLVATYPQMVDYPAHLARMHIMLTRDSSPYLQEYYGFQWRWMGNLGADILAWPLTRVMSLEMAGRVMAGLIPPLTGLSLLAAEWAVRRRIGLASLLAFAFGMVFFTVIMGNAFAAFPVMMAGIGLPLAHRTRLLFAQAVRYLRLFDCAGKLVLASTRIQLLVGQLSKTLLPGLHLHVVRIIDAGPARPARRRWATTWRTTHWRC